MEPGSSGRNTRIVQSCSQAGLWVEIRKTSESPTILPKPNWAQRTKRFAANAWYAGGSFLQFRSKLKAEAARFESVQVRSVQSGSVRELIFDLGVPRGILDCGQGYHPSR